MEPSSQKPLQPLPAHDAVNQYLAEGNYGRWKRWAWAIGGTLLTVLLVWGGLTMAAEMTERQIQKEYLTLTDDAGRASFAKRHANHVLGGLVLLGQAHDYYKSGNYAAAKAAYTQAVESGLKSQPVLQQEAMLGTAFASFALDKDAGIQALEALAQNPELLDTTRAQASAELVGWWAEREDWAKAKDYWKLLKTLNNAKPWQEHLAGIEQLYPRLKD